MIWNALVLQGLALAGKGTPTIPNVLQQKK
jgi:hypothetical protein